MALEPTRIVLAVSILLAVGFVWYYGGRDRWRDLVDDRFLYGVPWGTLITVAIVVAFYALAQGGLFRWSEPVTLPFVSWSYFYPTGLLTAGIAHGSPAHLASNMAGTLAFAPIVEYVWSHYPPSRSRERPGAAGGLLARPWIRIAVFPLALLAVAVVTAVFALGPGLGFSGVVFALAGFAVVNYPVATVVAVVVTSTLQTLFGAIGQPIVRETLEAGPPSPPAWAGVGFQAHLLGFLIGAVLGIFLLRRRRGRPSRERVFFGVVLFGMAQALWLLVWFGDDVYYLYQGAGVVLVLALAALTTVAVAGSDRPLLTVESGSWVPTRRQLAAGWLGLLAIGLLAGVAGAAFMEQPMVATTLGLVAVVVLLAVPALPPLVPDRFLAGSGSRRGVAVGLLLVVAVLVALPSVPMNLMIVGDDAVPGGGEVEVGGYAVTYEQNATSGTVPAVDPDLDDNPLESQHSGVIVVNLDREIWTVGTPDYRLEHGGNASVDVGGIGWSETIDVSRTGWEVLGNETAYGVDLELDGETTRSFTTDPVQADARLEGHELAIVPADEADEPFEIQVERDGSEVETAPIPQVNETVTVGDLELSTEDGSGGAELVASAGDTDIPIAERETYR